MSSPFPTTIWSQVRLGAGEGEARRAALETLARRYQAPAEAYLRAALRLEEERVRDLFQDFFVHLLEAGLLARADPLRGRFRAFLKVALRRFALDQIEKAGAARRGGDREQVALDGALVDPSAAAPEEELDRAWRAELVRVALERTREQLEREDRRRVHAVFRDYYLSPGPEVDYRGLAERHGITTGEVSEHLRRARRVFRDQLRAAVLETVHDAQELDDELRWMLQ